MRTTSRSLTQAKCALAARMVQRMREYARRRLGAGMFLRAYLLLNTGFGGAP